MDVTPFLGMYTNLAYWCDICSKKNRSHFFERVIETSMLPERKQSHVF